MTILLSLPCHGTPLLGLSSNRKGNYIWLCHFVLSITFIRHRSWETLRRNLGDILIGVGRRTHGSSRRRSRILARFGNDNFEIGTNTSYSSKDEDTLLLLRPWWCKLWKFFERYQVKSCQPTMLLTLSYRRIPLRNSDMQTSWPDHKNLILSQKCVRNVRESKCIGTESVWYSKTGLDLLRFSSNHKYFPPPSKWQVCHDDKLKRRRLLRRLFI